MLTLKDLELIQAIGDSGSLTGAAGQLHVTQSALSQRLAGLHDRCGILLAERRDGSMALTPAGQRVAAAAELVGREIAAASADLRALADQHAGRFRITTQCYTCYRWLPFVMSEMRQELPRVNVDVVPEATDTPFDALHGNQVDVAVISNPNTPSVLVEHELFEDELFAVMHEAHPLAERAYLPPERFVGQTLILYTGAKHAVVEEILKPAGVDNFKLIQVRMTEAIIELARSGLGIAVIAGWALDDMDADHLVPVRITRSGFKRTWRAVARENCEPAHLDSFVRSVRRVGGVIGNKQWRAKLRRRVA